MMAEKESIPPGFFPINDRFSVNLKKMQLGNGSFGKVYMGYDVKQGKHIAVKQVMPENKNAIQNQLREIKVMEKLDHKNILKLYGFYKDKDNIDGLYIFLQLCEDQNFSKLIKQKLTEEQTYVYFEQLVEGMDYMNTQNIFHRDLKPQNLLKGHDGELKIADFGIARQIESNNIKYTPFQCSFHYSAPQIMFGEVQYNQKCDVYSVGYILYEMLTCEKLIEKSLKVIKIDETYETQSDQVRYMIRKIKQQGGWKINHPSLIDKPQWVALLNRMLEIDPNKRISFKQIKKELKGIKPTSTKPISRTLTEKQSQQSKQYRIVVERNIKYRVDFLNYLTNILKIERQPQIFVASFVPKIYKVALLYLTLVRYCRMAEVFLQKIANGMTIQMMNGELCPYSFDKMVNDDQVAVDYMLDDTSLKLNQKKERVKAILTMHIIPFLHKIFQEQRFLLERSFLNEIPQFQINLNNYNKISSDDYDSFYLRGLNFLVGNLFKTNAQLQIMMSCQLRVYLTFSLIAKLEQFNRQSFNDFSSFLPSHADIALMQKQQLLSRIKDLKIQGGFKKQKMN